MKLIVGNGLKANMVQNVALRQHKGDISTFIIRGRFFELTYMPTWILRSWQKIVSALWTYSGNQMSYQLYHHIIPINNTCYPPLPGTCSGK